MDLHLPAQPDRATLPPELAARAETLVAEFMATLSEPLPELPGLGTVLLGSDYVAKTIRRWPHYLLEALDADGQMPARSLAELHDWFLPRLQAVTDDQQLKACLRELRHRELVRIAWRDLLGVATLDEVMHDLTRLADVLVQAALDWHAQQLEQRYGTPRDSAGTAQSMVVLGMGKLGGQELNFSSDIDLIFAYWRPGSTDGPRAMDNQEFFQRLGRAVIAALADGTSDGFCYRVDMRLRPFGSAGPLVMHFDAMEDYYQAHGREWERYALIKARVMAGDRLAGQRLMEKLQPFIYRRYLDYGAFENLRELKQMINEESVRRERVDDIKHGEGGIREVEFVAQVFQLVRGGRDPKLQRRDLLGTLEVLAERKLMPLRAVQQLIQGYRFLRRVENRLQMLADQQTHHLPTDVVDRARLAFVLGYRDTDAFLGALQRHQRRVQNHFEQVFAAPQGEVAETDSGSAQQRFLHRLWHQGMAAEVALPGLASAGFKEPAAAFALIDDLRQGAIPRNQSETGRQRLDRLMPLLLGAIAELEDPDLVLPRALDLIRTISRRSVYLALLVEHPLALSQWVKLCEASPWISDQLARHPLLLDELMDPRVLYAPPNRDGLRQELDLALSQCSPEDHEEILERLRQFKQVQTLRIAAADIMGYLPLMRVSDHLTWLAEVLLQKVLDLSWKLMTDRHGEPHCGLGQARRRARFAIVGYGKLGGLELGYGSDLDLVFLHDSEGESARTRGPRVIDNAEFFARVGQRIVHILGAYTAAGRLYEVDTRLRPSGSSGLLVSSMEAFAHYQRQSAWTWEHQALVRARWVAGEPELEAGFSAVRRDVLCRQRDPGKLRAEVVEMRNKMLAEHGSRDPAWFDLKRDRGGITDIEFMVQYWVLATAHQQPDVGYWSDKVRILESLGQAAVITPDLAQALADAYRALRNRIHRSILAGGDGRIKDPPADICALREQVTAAWYTLFGDLETSQGASDNGEQGE